MQRRSLLRALYLTLAISLSSLATVDQVRAQSNIAPTPTTRILAIGTLNAGVDPQAVRAVLPAEVRATVRLYLAGRIDQWYSLEDRIGVAFILNVTDPAVAHAMLEDLPLGKAHLMSFELIPLGPLGPLRQLPGMSDGAP